MEEQEPVTLPAVMSLIRPREPAWGQYLHWRSSQPSHPMVAAFSPYLRQPSSSERSLDPIPTPSSLRFHCCREVSLGHVIRGSTKVPLNKEEPEACRRGKCTKRTGVSAAKTCVLALSSAPRPVRALRRTVITWQAAHSASVKGMNSGFE